MRPEGNVLKGVALVVSATLLFAMADVLTKHLSLHFAVPLVVAVRNAVNVMVLIAVLGPRERAGLWRTKRTFLVVLRGLVLAVGSLSMGLALRVMPLGETIAIIYLSPFAVMLLAGPLLGEKVAAQAWLFASIGFLGVLLIARPGSGLDPWGVFMALINGASATGYHLLTRVLLRTETTTSMLFHTALAGFVVFAVLTVLGGDGEMPGTVDALAMVALGVLATIGHFLFTAAYREAPASTLAPINYSHLIWAGVLGWLVFDHLPDAITALGMALVSGAGVAIALSARRSRTRVEVVEEAEFG